MRDPRPHRRTARAPPPREAAETSRSGRRPVIEAKPLSWAEVDAHALRSNLLLFRRMLRGTGPHHPEVVPVVKSNAYGHGVDEVLRALADGDVRWLGVNSVDEGLRVRALSPDARILVMGYADPARFPEAVDASLDLTLTNPEELPELDRIARASSGRARVHVKIETGTHRRGLVESEHEALAEAFRTSSATDWVGVSTHFANIEDTINHEYAQSQLARFHTTVDTLASRGVRFQMRHVACTAAALLFPETHLDLVRVGIGLYGLWPSRETRLSYRNAGRGETPELEPVLSWKSRLTQVKDVPGGSFVGYGCTYKTTAASRIGVVPVGYYEGYPRQLSNAAHMLVRGQRAPVRGRVCMNMTLVDLTHVSGAEVGDEVVLVGCQGEESVSIDDLATLSGTINYEIVSRISPTVGRVLVNDEVPAND